MLLKKINNSLHYSLWGWFKVGDDLVRTEDGEGLTAKAPTFKLKSRAKILGSSSLRRDSVATDSPLIRCNTGVNFWGFEDTFTKAGSLYNCLPSSMHFTSSSDTSPHTMGRR
jgi:hypothetical protein